MAQLYIPVLAGTTREQRKSIIHAARLVMEVGKEFPEVETELVDPKDFIFPGDGNDPEGKDLRYTAITARADGFFIVTPEYNHTIPGSLKRMIDSELKNYVHKAVAFGGASSTQWGGVRAGRGAGDDCARDGNGDNVYRHAVSQSARVVRRTGCSAQTRVSRSLSRARGKS